MPVVRRCCAWSTRCTPFAVSVLWIAPNFARKSQVCGFPLGLSWFFFACSSYLLPTSCISLTISESPGRNKVQNILDSRSRMRDSSCKEAFVRSSRSRPRPFFVSVLSVSSLLFARHSALRVQGAGPAPGFLLCSPPSSGGQVSIRWLRTGREKRSHCRKLRHLPRLRNSINDRVRQSASEDAPP